MSVSSVSDKNKTGERKSFREFPLKENTHFPCARVRKFCMEHLKMCHVTYLLQYIKMTITFQNIPKSYSELATSITFTASHKYTLKFTISPTQSLDDVSSVVRFAGRPRSLASTRVLTKSAGTGRLSVGA